MDKNQPYGQSERANRVGMFERPVKRAVNPLVPVLFFIALVLLIVLVILAF